MAACACCAGRGYHCQQPLTLPWALSHLLTAQLSSGLARSSGTCTESKTSAAVGKRRAGARVVSSLATARPQPGPAEIVVFGVHLGAGGQLSGGRQSRHVRHSQPSEVRLPAGDCCGSYAVHKKPKPANEISDSCRPPLAVQPAVLGARELPIGPKKHAGKAILETGDQYCTLPLS